MVFRIAPTSGSQRTVNSLSLLTLGRCELRRVRPDGGFDALPLTGKPMALLLRLASAADQLLSRNVLANELWSDFDREHALAQFRTALWSLRKHLPTDAIRADDSTVGLAQPLATDRGEFQAAVRAGEYAKAVALYRGDFLAHFAISGAQGFEEWVDLERRNLRGLFIGAAVAEAQRLTLAARFADAVALATRARDAEPLNQAVWRALLQALISAGDAVTVRAEASAFVELHAEEQFAIETDTSRLLRLARASVPVVPDGTGTPDLEAELVGRERELAGLLDLVDRTRRGRPHSACITGPPGIGKTRLAQDFSRSAAAHRASVVSIAAPRATQRVPYGSIARLAERLANLRGARGISAASAAVLVGLHPALSSIYQNAPAIPAPADHGTRLLALVELVSAVAEETTLVIVIDDAQWLDDASREIIHALPESCADSALFLVVSSRGPVQSALDFAPTASFVLEPLSPALSEAMVGSIAKLPDAAWAAEWVHALHHSARGVPLGVLDVTRLGLERAAVEIRDGSWECRDANALMQLTEAAAPREARIAQLPDAARRLALVLALVGTPTRLETVAAVLGLDGDALASATRVLVERGIGQAEADALSLTHEEYSMAAIASAPVGERRQLRVRLAEALAGRNNEAALRRAYALAEEAEESLLADRIAEQYFLLARQRTPGTDVRAAMADLIGIGASATRLEELVNQRQRPSRMRRNVMGVAAAVAVVAAGVFAVPAVWPSAPEPDAIVVAQISVGDSLFAVQVPLTLGDWSAAKPIRVDARSASAISSTAMRNITRSPVDSGLWLGAESRNDLVTDDIVVVRNGSPPRYVNSSRGDDVSPVWSPNGKQIAFITARWSGDRGDIAIADLDTDSVTRVAGTQGRIDLVTYRADGAGLAYLRKAERTSDRELCAIRLSDRTPRCRAVGPGTNVSSIAWPNPSLVYYTESGDGGQAYLRAWDLTLDSTRVVAACLSANLYVDARAAFIVCPASERVPNAMIAPLARPDQMRRVEIVGLPSTATGSVSVIALSRPRAVTKFRISPARDAIVGIPHLLRATRQEVDGGLAQPSPVVWSLIGGDASVSERGVMLARAPGTVTLLASDGFAPETLTIAVRAREDSLLLDERWAADWHSRWTPFGVPLPEVVTARGARAFWNAGDGKYFSGAYSKQEWDARSGLSADFDLSTHLTADTSQLVRIGFKSGGDSAVLAGWDHRTGYGPGLAHQKWCKFQFPTGDGKTASAKYAAEGAADAAAGMVGSGAKYRMRIQIFPDGRCGVALNGRPIGMSPDAGQEPTARFYIDGSTVKTQFLVFGVTIRRGVPPGVEWPAGPPR